VERIFLQAYARKLETVGWVCRLLRWQRGYVIPSSATFGKIGEGGPPAAAMPPRSSALIAAVAGRGHRHIAAELEPAGQHGPPLAAPRRLASRVAAPARHGPRRRTRPTRTCRPACIRDRPSWALRLPALAAAMHATRRPLGPMTIPAWPLIVVLTGGRLLAPLRGS